MTLARNLQTILTFTVAFATLSMSACSMRNMYNYLDWIIPFYIDDYVTLTDQQEKIFDSVTIQFLRWHRTEELPRYERFIISFKDAQTTPMSQDQILLLFDDAEALWTALLKESMPSLLELSVDLNEKQLQEIDYALVIDIRELQNKYGNRTEIQRRAFLRDKMSDAMVDWLGRVTVEQAEMIQLWSATIENTTDDWLAYRNNWRQKFMELLYNRHASNYIADMSLFLLKPQKTYSTSYRQVFLENRRHFAQFLADISTTFTPQQREHLQHELVEIIDDLKELTPVNGK